MVQLMPVNEKVLGEDLAISDEQLDVQLSEDSNTPHVIVKFCEKPDNILTLILLIFRRRTSLHYVSTQS